MARNSLGQPQAESNGVAVWMLRDGLPDWPKGGASILCGSRLETADRIEAMVTDGSDAALFSSDFFPLLGKDIVDLSIRRIVKLTGQTNFVQAVRAQLPYGHALFVLDVRQPESVTNRMGFLITADEYDAKGNKLHEKAVGK